MTLISLKSFLIVMGSMTSFILLFFLLIICLVVGELKKRRSNTKALTGRMKQLEGRVTPKKDLGHTSQEMSPASMCVMRNGRSGSQYNLCGEVVEEVAVSYVSEANDPLYEEMEEAMKFDEVIDVGIEESVVDAIEPRQATRSICDQPVCAEDDNDDFDYDYVKIPGSNLSLGNRGRPVANPTYINGLFKDRSLSKSSLI